MIFSKKKKKVLAFIATEQLRNSNLGYCTTQLKQHYVQIIIKTNPRTKSCVENVFVEVNTNVTL